MIGDKDSDEFQEFLILALKHLVIEHPDEFQSPDDLADCWHPDLIGCIKNAKASNSIPDLMEALVYKKRAIRSQIENRLDHAKANYAASIQAFPGCPHFRFMLGAVCAQKCEWEEARELFTQYLSSNPEAWEAQNRLALCHFSLGEYDSAIDLLENIMHEYYEPMMSLLLGTCFYQKGERLGKDLYRKTGVYDQDATARIVGPHLEKALHHLMQFRQYDESQDEQFDKACNLYDMLKPGKLQEMGIPLSLNRLHRVVLGDCRENPPEQVLRAEFRCNKIVRSAGILSCVRGTSSGRYQTDIMLFETDDTDRIGNDKPVGWFTMLYPGHENPEVPDIAYNLGA